MSVIFKTLKKLQQQTDPQGRGADGARLRKTGLLHRFLNTPFFIGLFLGVIIIAGFLRLYGLGGISNTHRGPRGSTPKFMAAKETLEPVKSSDHPALKISSTISAGAKVLPPLFEQSFSGSSTPTPMEKSNIMVAKTDKAQNEISFPTVLEPNDPPIPTQAASTFKDDLSKDDPLLLGQDKGLFKTVSVKTGQTSDSQQQRRLANLEKFRRTAKKRADIAKLVTQIEAAVLSMDAPEVKKLMQKLSLVKGRDNLYVLNLKAFWYLKQKRYLEAEALLKEILKRDQDHLEAGVNMAVVEAETQRKEAALKRLRRLKALYPENQVLIEMIRKLS